MLAVQVEVVQAVLRTVSVMVLCQELGLLVVAFALVGRKAVLLGVMAATAAGMLAMEALVGELAAAALRAMRVMVAMGA